jgi:hypothetical protein
MLAYLTGRRLSFMVASPMLEFAILLWVIVTGPDIWVAAAIAIRQAKSWSRYFITVLLTSAAVVALRSGLDHATWPDGPLVIPFYAYLISAVFFVSVIGAAIRLRLFRPYDER